MSDENPSVTRSMDHAYGALVGLAIGDALGMPTQSLTREEIIKHYGVLIDDFYDADATHPFARGLTRGSVTDDTEQSLLLANLLIASRGNVDVRQYAAQLLAWEESVRARGLFDLLGPSTKKALLNLGLGEDPSITGREGTTNGAAMRVAPVGISVATSDVGRLVHVVVEVSALTHNTAIALSGAVAVASVVSAGVEGKTITRALEKANDAVRIVEERFGASGVSMSERLSVARDIALQFTGEELLRVVNDRLGTSVASEESIPAAFALLQGFNENVWAACCAAASVGGDCDTIAAMTGTMAGALHGASSIPLWASEFVQEKNQLDLCTTAYELLKLRV